MKLNSKEFKKLKAEWYEKLRESKFKDMERDEDHLKNAANNNILNFRKNNKESFAIKQEYYRLAGHFFHDHNFETFFDCEVWRLHSEGVSIRNIVKTLKESGHKAYKFKVDTAIRDLRKLMIKMYGVSAHDNQQE